MSRLLLVLVAVLALAGAAVWFVTAAHTERSSRPSAADVPAAEIERETPALDPVRTTSEDDGARNPERPAASAASARHAAATSKDAELARAQWIDGRVLFPAGTPDDEAVFVTAEGRGFDDDSDHRVQVERDGSFRVAFSEKARTGRFELEARYLYLGEIVRWKSKESTGQVVLEPKLGARIAGQVRVPAGTDSAGVGGKLELEVSRQTGSSSDNEQVGLHELSQGLDFAFDALLPGADPARTYALSYDGEAFLGRIAKLVPEAGETVTVELELRPGLTLAGVVRDESGASLEGVELMANVQSSSGSWTSAHHRRGDSAADGSFRLGALAGGKVELRAQLAGYEPLVRELGRLEEGQSVPDLELVFTRGHSIAGTVRWPDGSPAEATLVLVPHRSGVRWTSQDEVNGTSDEQGAFTVSGLSQESYRVTARATKTEEILEKSELTGRERPKKKRSEWSAEVEQVKVGTSTLALTLSTGLAVEGRVVDDLGAPLANFSILADRVESGPRFDPDGDRSRLFRDTDGSFRMDGFAGGEWTLRGRSKDHAASEPVRVTLPGGDPILLVVPREAVVSGRVLDPSGAPLAAASVEAQVAGEHGLSSFRSDDEDVVDENGSFEIDGLGPGKIVLRAHGSSFASSAPESVELGAGETRTGLVLRLRPGGTILGELVGSEGRPLSGHVSLDGEGFEAYPETDAEGRFQVSGVPPGEIFLWAQTEEGIQIQQRVTLSEGETVRVRLAPPGRLVRLHGRVRAGGEALVGANLWASRAGEREDAPGSSSSSETGEDGAYEIQLPGSGRYWLSVNSRAEKSLSWGLTLDVPAVEALEFDVAIPVGRISGRVTDTQGQALARVLVESEPEQHEGDAHGSAQARTDSEGRYELLVPAGQHAVMAGGGRNPWLQEESRPYAEARVGGLVVSANGHVRGIDLVLATGGILEGVAHKARSGFVRIWSEEGEHARDLGWTDENGHFELRGVTPGVHLIGARGRTVATREPVRVEIVAGETRHLELELVDARLVHLNVREKGLPVGSEIRVLDGRERHQPVESGANGEAWLGPLIPGSYTVHAQRDGKQVERAFEVTAGQEQLELELVFE